LKDAREMEWIYSPTAPTRVAPKRPLDNFDDNDLSEAEVSINKRSWVSS
jgi:hypothetical protein